MVLHAATASAQPEDRPAARPLFDQGRELMQAGRYTEACPKLEQAVKLFAGAGLLLNLADCYEHTGQLASAWTRFGDAAAAAHRAGNAEAEAEANRRRSLLEPKLTPVPAPSPLESGSPAPAGASSATQTPAEPTPAANTDTTTAPSVATPADEGLGTRRIVALSLGAAGVAGLATGSVFGLMAISQKNQQQSDCGSTASCTGSGHAQALGDHSSAVSDGMISTVGFLAGGALLVAGAVVFLTGSSSVVTPSVGPSGAGLSWGGRF